MNPRKNQSTAATSKVPSSILKKPKDTASTTAQPPPRRQTLAAGDKVADGSRPVNIGRGHAPSSGSVAALNITKQARQRAAKPSPSTLVVGSDGMSSRRHVSMPQVRTPSFGKTHGMPPTSTAHLPPPEQRHIPSDANAHLRSPLLPNPGSPPIFDFTRFEDTYRGPRTGAFEGLMPGTKTGQRSVSGGCNRPGAPRDGDSEGGATNMRDPYPTVASHNALRGPASSTMATSTTVAGLAPAPASSRKPDPRRVLNALEGMLGDDYRISDYLHSHELLGMHQLDQLDFEERDRSRATFVKTGKLVVRRGEKGVISVLGEPIRAASIYSSATVVLSGREHEIPIIVVNTVEELYRTGIYQANLFRNLPNRGRLMELINIFDSEEQAPGSVIRPRQPSAASAPTHGGGSRNRPPAPVHPGFGAMTSLHLESTPDVCALLTTYISSLREPVLCRFLFSAIWDWCGVGDEELEDSIGGGYPSSSFAPRLSSIPLARTYTSPDDSAKIATAQLLLHLLPSPHFSLLVYLLAFFSQVALVREENGVGVADLARMYGARIFGGDSVQDPASGKTRTRDGETMMRWFLRRWGPLSEGLFEVLDDASMGLFRRTQARRDSFGKDILSSWSSINDASSTDSGDTETVRSSGSSDDREDESVLGSLTTVRDRTFKRRRDTPGLAKGKDYFEAGFDPQKQSQLTPCKLLSARSISDRSLDDLRDRTPRSRGGTNESDFVILPSARAEPGDETLDISGPHLNSRGEVDERLMDMSMTKLMSEAMDFPEDNSIPDIIVNTPTPPNQSPPQPCPEPAHLTTPVSDAMKDSNASAARTGDKLEDDPVSDTTTIAKLKEENAALHNTIWRLEAELAKLRRDNYVASSSRGSTDSALTRDMSKVLESSTSSGKRTPDTKGGSDMEDAEAVRIVAAIRKLMAKN